MGFKAGYVWDYFLAGCCDFLGFLLVAWQPHIDEETSGNIQRRGRFDVNVPCLPSEVLDPSGRGCHHCNLTPD